LSEHTISNSQDQWNHAGTAWFQDLADSDPTYTLPAINLIVTLLNIEFSLQPTPANTVEVLKTTKSRNLGHRAALMMSNPVALDRIKVRWQHCWRISLGHDLARCTGP